MNRKASTAQWIALLDGVREGNPDVEVGAMFGMPCAKVSGRAFMGSFDGGVVFKLAGATHADALARSGAELFDPSGRGKPMRAWVVMPLEHHDAWPALAQAALDLARS